MSALPQPKPGEGIVFCTHQMRHGMLPTFSGGSVLKMLPDQMLAPGELPHEWLIVCRACKAEKDRDPNAIIHGFCFDWPEGAEIPYPEDHAS